MYLKRNGISCQSEMHSQQTMKKNRVNGHKITNRKDQTLKIEFFKMKRPTCIKCACVCVFA